VEAVSWTLRFLCMSYELRQHKDKTGCFLWGFQWMQVATRWRFCGVWVTVANRAVWDELISGCY